jgi:hypothetical protein
VRRPAETAAASGAIASVGFSAPEEVGWITGFAVNANGGHVHQ